MSVDRSTRNALAALFLIAALFVAMNRVVASAPAADWWLPLVLFILGIALVFTPQFSRAQPDEHMEEKEQPALPASAVHTYEVTAPAQRTPRLHTMTIRPDPDLAQYDTTISAESAVLPFIEAEVSKPSVVETPVSPETPAPAVEPEPEPEATPMSPETPAPEAEPEPTVMSPETPTPDVEQRAPEVKFSARSEYAEPDAVVAKKEAPATPPPDESITAPQRAALEKDAVSEKMSAPQQPYEAEMVGAITPEQTDRILDDSTDNAYDQNVPVVSEAAAPRVIAQERNEGTVGSADDLTKLNGIGRKSAAALRAAGIDSFHKLANSTDEAIRAALATAGVRLIGDVNTWSHQAAYAARSDWAGLEHFNAERKSASGD